MHFDPAILAEVALGAGGVAIWFAIYGVALFLTRPADVQPAPSTQETPAAAPAPEPVVVATQPSPEPTQAPVGNTGEGSAGGRGNRGGGWGGIIGGIIGSVIIRGGMGGEDHCDPRHDGRNRPVYPDIPVSRMPVNTGGVFAGHGRH